MKKKLYLLLTVAMLLCMSFTACSSAADTKDTESEKDWYEEDTEEYEWDYDEEEIETEMIEIVPDANVSTDWKNYEFSVNGTILTLPCTYNELKNTSGFYMESANEKSYLEKGYASVVNLYHGDEEDLALNSQVANLTDGEQQYTDCEMTYVGQSADMVFDYGAAPVTFPGGLVVGMEISLEKLTEMFGEPDDVYEWTSDSTGTCYNTYTWEEESAYDSYEIELEDGVISKLSLKHVE